MPHPTATHATNPATATAEERREHSRARRLAPGYGFFVEFEVARMSICGAVRESETGRYSGFNEFLRAWKEGRDGLETPEKAILAGGCFWGMQDLIRKRPGVLSTRVGYTGGDVANATYRNHGTHAEAIEIIFDPEQTSYRDCSSSSSRSTIRRR